MCGRITPFLDSGSPWCRFVAATLRRHFADWKHPLFVLMLYAGIVVVDGLALQPYLMKRTAKVPIWASIVTPIVLAFVIPYWGVFLAPPLLAVIYAYKRHLEQKSSRTS